MKILRGILCCVLLCSPLVYAASDSLSPQQIAINLKGNVAFLRGMESGDTLKFDAQGNELGTVATGPFAYSAVEIKEAKVSDAALEITGNRDAMVFEAVSSSTSSSDIRFVPLQEPITISIALDSAHPEALQKAIRKVFAFSAQEALAGKPKDEVQADLETLGSTAHVDGWRDGPEKKTGVYQFRPGMPTPRLLQSAKPDPLQSAGASKKNPEGAFVVSMIVDTSGRPTHIRFLRASNSAMKTEVLEAVSQYRFAPFIYKGHEVPVLIQMEVSFHLR